MVYVLLKKNVIDFICLRGALRKEPHPSSAQIFKLGIFVSYLVFQIFWYFELSRGIRNTTEALLRTFANV